MRTTPIVAAVALGLVAGCGSGLTDGLGEAEVTQTVAPPGPADVTLAQARLIIGRNTIGAPAVITLRRLPDAPAGAIGPVFELDVAGGDFTQRPILEIAVSGTARVPAEAMVVAHYGTDGTKAHWLPLSSNRAYDPRTRTVRGDVTVQISGGKNRFGTLAWCGHDGPRVECATGQTCYGGACQ